MSSSIKVPASVKVPALLLLASVLLFVAFVSMQTLLAELHAIQPRYLLSAGDDSQWRERDRVYADALQMTDTLIAIEGSNPDYREMKARLLINNCRHWNISEHWEDWQQCQRDAQSQLRIVVSSNPRWPFGWANLLLTKYNLRQFDEEFYTALKNSQLFGHSEAAVNKVVAYVGLQEWARWDAALRNQFKQALLSLNDAAPEQAMQLAHETQQDFLYCLWTADIHKPADCSYKIKAARRQ